MDRFDRILQRAFDEEVAEPATTPGLRPLPMVRRDVRLLPELDRRWSRWRSRSWRPSGRS